MEHHYYMFAAQEVSDVEHRCQVQEHGTLIFYKQFFANKYKDIELRPV